MEYTIHNINIKYSGFFTLEEYELSHSLFAGGESPLIKRELLKKGDAAAVLLFDPKLNNLVLIEQFRIGAMKDKKSAWLIELVAGFIEKGELAEDVIRRDTLEEANCVFSDPLFISDYYANPASTSERIKLYCAKIDSSSVGGIYGLKEEGEDIRVKVVSVEEAFSLLADGSINAATPIIALLWLQLNIEELKQKWA